MYFGIRIYLKSIQLKTLVLIFSQFPRDCYSLAPDSVSGVYKIQPVPNIEPIEVYCEMAIHGGGFTFLPRRLTRTPHAQLIVRALLRDKKNVLLKLQKKADRSEFYTLIQPHPSFANTDFGVLVNSFSGYTTPQNAFMKEYIFLGIIPASAARTHSYQGFRSNGHTIQFRNCDKNPNSLFALMPNHNLQKPQVLLKPALREPWCRGKLAFQGHSYHKSRSHDAKRVLLPDGVAFRRLRLLHVQ